MFPFLRRVLVAGFQHIRTESEDTIRELTLMQFNTLLIHHNDAWSRFEVEARRRLGDAFETDTGVDPNHHGFFGWFRCSTLGVRKICQDGFDPLRRQGCSLAPEKCFRVTSAPPTAPTM